MFSTDDTIVAIATPGGRGGLGVVRLSGPAAPSIANALLDRSRPLRPRYATFARLGAGGVRDEVVVTWFPAPRSFTGEDVIEISAHGSPVVLQGILREASAAGARLARPGEFTLRAFLNGRRDLVQAEAVADLVEAATPLQASVACDQLEGTLTRRLAAIESRLFDVIARLEASLDFPDEGYHFVSPDEAAGEAAAIVRAIDGLLQEARRGRLIRDGATVVVAGRPNVGKSSLFNRLVGGDRAIVTEVPGTTRDLISERLDLDGLAVTLVDTAGARDTVDIVEREGVQRAAHARTAADAVVLVLDLGEPLTREDHGLVAAIVRGGKHLIAANKSDRHCAWSAHDWRMVEEASDPGRPLRVSAHSGEGINELRRAIAGRLSGDEPLQDRPAVTNLRHIRLLEAARADLGRAAAAGRGRAPEEFVLAELQAARGRFGEIVGTRTDEDLLRHIFERFCIGK